MVMFCRRIIVGILISNYVLSFLPLSPDLSSDINQSRELVSGWPNLGIVDIRQGPDGSIIAGTGSGLGLIDNSSLLNSIENNIYYFSDSNLPIGSNPATKTYDNGNLIVVSGVIGTNEEPEGTGISWSLDGGETWNYIQQPVDQSSNAYITKFWNGYSFEQLSISTAVKNVSYDIDVDLEYEYIYATSWAGMLQRFKYTNSNPSWELVPLPMDGQDNLSCDFSCDTSNGQVCCNYTSNQSPNQNCSNNPNDYYANPVDNTGFDNHKAFSVYIDELYDYIWVGTAYGVNRGEIISENCIEWVHYTRENTNTSLAANWVIGFHRQNSINGFSRLWAITWEPNSSTPHKLSYTDDNGDTWQNDNRLQQGIGAVTYSLNSSDDEIYASTSKGLFEINPFVYGCTDISADNYDPLATINGGCQYINSEQLVDGCELESDYLYIIQLNESEYQVLYNSSTDILTINFDIIGADILRDENNQLLIEGDGFLPYYQWSESQPSNSSFLGGELDASAIPGIPAGCGVLFTMSLSNAPDGLSNILVNGSECYNYYTLGSECNEDNQWSKVEIPDWIFDNLFIANEQNSGFKVYSSYASESNDLWIGTTRGLIVADMSIEPYQFYQPSLSNADSFTIYPNPYLSDTEAPVIFELETSGDNVKLEIYDFTMTKIITLSSSNSSECQTNGEFLRCAWRGMTENGRKVANGVYFCKLEVDGQVYWEKLAVLNIR